MVMVTRGEPESLATAPLVNGSARSFTSIPRLFNAGLVLLDGQESPRPYLAQAMPQLQEDSWQLLDGGRMETTYVLRPNLTWQDGAPLLASDFAFGWEVYRRAPADAAETVAREIEEVSAPDARTIVIRWKSLFPRAGALQARDLPPLPRARLGSGFASSSSEVLARSEFWSREYVGLGPYRLQTWEAGSHLSAAAFSGHAHGRPKIGQLRVLFLDRFEEVAHALMSGEAHATIDEPLRFAQAGVLRKEWAQRGDGVVLSMPNQWRYIEIQHRLDLAHPRALQDARVRRALAFSLDRDGMNAVLYDGEATVADSFVPPTVDYFRVVDLATVKYPFDPRRAERLMGEAGFTRTADTPYSHPSEGRFSAELRTNATAQGAGEVAALGEAWRREGFDVHEVTVPPAQTRMGEVRSTFPGLYSASSAPGSDAIGKFASSRMAAPANRWSGANRGGWISGEYDSHFDAFQKALDRTQRAQELAEMARLVSRSVAAISLYFSPSILAHAATLDGPQVVSPSSDPVWNIHAWELR